MAWAAVRSKAVVLLVLTLCLLLLPLWESVIVLRMFCCTLLYVHSGIAIILMGKRELITLLNLSSWCLVMVEWLFLAVPWGCLQFVIVVLSDHTHLLFLNLFSSQAFERLLTYRNDTASIQCRATIDPPAKRWRVDGGPLLDV